jgi:hypothetical protein
VLLEPDAIRISTPLIVPFKKHFSIQAYRSKYEVDAIRKSYDPKPELPRYR